jgi:thiamine-phosphate pyrophosphorylase
MIRCYVTDRHQGDVLAHVERAVALGVEMIQVREKDLAASELLNLVCRVRDIAAGHAGHTQMRTKVLVNGRLDIALIAGIDGVHLPGDGLPAAQVRPHVRTLGVSCHSIEEAVQAERDSVDYIIYGPVFETPGKRAVGIDALRRFAQSVKIPVLAIGGITSDNAAAAIEAGAAGIAAIRMFQQR